MFDMYKMLKVDGQVSKRLTKLKTTDIVCKLVIDQITKTNVKQIF